MVFLNSPETKRQRIMIIVQAVLISKLKYISKHRNIEFVKYFNKIVVLMFLEFLSYVLFYISMILRKI